MEAMETGNVSSILYPNNAQSEDAQGWYRVGKHCDEIRKIFKNGEMAAVGWFQVIKDGQVIAEIKESVCDICYEPVDNICAGDGVAGE